jgi:hypothetical protein
LGNGDAVKSFRQNIRGTRYKIRFVNSRAKNMGECDAPDTKAPEIRIREGQSERDELDTLIHEASHACDFDRAEHAVTETANAISALLWRLGWRRKA